MPPNHDTLRRLKLRVAVKLMLAAMLLGFVYLGLSPFFGGQEAESIRTRFEVSLAPGEVAQLSWGRLPVLVLAWRDEQQQRAVQRAKDEGGFWDKLPEGVDKHSRSLDGRHLVVLALSPDFTCPVDYVPPGGAFQGQPWRGGFVEQCRGIRYDHRGRLLEQQAGQGNLQVPEHRWRGGRLEIW